MFSLNEYMLCSFQISVALNFSGFLQTIKSFNSKLSLDRKSKKKEKEIGKAGKLMKYKKSSPAGLDLEFKI